MTQAKGQQASIIMAELPEATYGTNPASVHAVKLPINTFGLDPARTLIDPAAITGRRDAVMPSQGRIALSGNAVVPIDKCAIGYWLQTLLGPPSTTLTGSAYSHVFKVNSVLTSRVLEQRHADISEYLLYNGVKANGFSMAVGGDEELTMSIDMIGQKFTPGGSSFSSRVTTLSLDRFSQFNAQLLEGGAALDAKVTALNINVANNLDESVYCIQSGNQGYRSSLPEGFAMVTGDMRILFENRSYYVMAISGTERSLQLNFVQGSYQLQFLINELIYELHAPPIDTPQGLWLTLPWKAYFDNPSSDQTIMQVTLVNTWAAYSGHL